MAVIWKKRGGFKAYVTPTGQPPNLQDIQMAREYNEQLQKKIKEITVSLKRKGFFQTRNMMKKWHMLGDELQFLDEMDLRLKCDPDMKNTWRALYDLAPHLAPRENIPTDKERAVGKRNHFYRCYILGKMPWDEVKHLTWANWNDIFMSFSSDMWKDYERLLNWVIDRASADKEITRSRLRMVLKALRRAIGERAEVARDTTVLSKEELEKILDQKLEEVAS